MCGFIAQLVEQRTGNAEVTGSNPVEALYFFRLLLSNCLNWKKLKLKNEMFHIYFASQKIKDCAPSGSLMFAAFHNLPPP